MPLEIKNLFLLAGTTLGGRSISAIYSNIGKIQLPDVFETYVDSFGFFTSTDKLQMCSCSYGDKMRVGITSKILSHNIQRNFLRILKEEGIHVTEQENDFPGYQEKKLGLMQKSMQIFTFFVYCCGCDQLGGQSDASFRIFVGRLCERGSTLYLAVCNG